MYFFRKENVTLIYILFCRFIKPQKEKKVGFTVQKVKIIRIFGA